MHCAPLNVLRAVAKALPYSDREASSIDRCYSAVGPITSASGEIDAQNTNVVTHPERVCCGIARVMAGGNMKHRRIRLMDEPRSACQHARQRVPVCIQARHQKERQHCEET